VLESLVATPRFESYVSLGLTTGDTKVSNLGVATKDSSTVYSRSNAILIGRGTRLTNQNPRLPSHISFQSHLIWHSGTEVVASGKLHILLWKNYVQKRIFTSLKSFCC
jgi:hypothetical protein